MQYEIYITALLCVDSDGGRGFIIDADGDGHSDDVWDSDGDVTVTV